MRGTGHAAVDFHRKCPVTKQMQQDWLARRVKNAGIKVKYILGNCVRHSAYVHLFYIGQNKENK